MILWRFIWAQKKINTHKVICSWFFFYWSDTKKKRIFFFNILLLPVWASLVILSVRATVLVLWGADLPPPPRAVCVCLPHVISSRILITHLRHSRDYIPLCALRLSYQAAGVEKDSRAISSLGSRIFFFLLSFWMKKKNDRIFWTWFCKRKLLLFFVFVPREIPHYSSHARHCMLSRRDVNGVSHVSVIIACYFFFIIIGIIEFSRRIIFIA